VAVRADTTKQFKPGTGAGPVCIVNPIETFVKYIFDLLGEKYGERNHLVIPRNEGSPREARTFTSSTGFAGGFLVALGMTVEGIMPWHNVGRVEPRVRPSDFFPNCPNRN
jgi:hypothetical protein